MAPDQFVSLVLDPGLSFLASVLGPDDIVGQAKPDLRLLMLAIAGQESGWDERCQAGGPARSFWQFEQGGGVKGVLNHPATKDRIGRVCAALCIPCDAATVYEAMAWNDHLSVAMARLLLWPDPAPLPARGDQQGAWSYYSRNWRPGRPRPNDWPARYGSALAVA